MEKKFDLENFVKDNKNLFNTEEPNEGHFDRFLDKLEQKSSRKNRFIYKSMRYAAVIVLLISGFLIYTKTDLFTSDEIAMNNSANVEITEDFTEISGYYDSQIDQKLAEINTLECKKGSEEKVVIEGDLKELSESYTDLKNEYNSDPGNQMIQNALISNFQMRLNILDMVLNKLKNYC